MDVHGVARGIHGAVLDEAQDAWSIGIARGADGTGLNGEVLAIHVHLAHRIHDNDVVVAHVEVEAQGQGLGGEVVENLPSRPLQALDALGASRSKLATNAVFPMGIARYLLYFFYRFETCVREATILGMLGVVSLGYYVVEARAHNDYDQMLLLICLGAVLVFVADVISDVARKLLQ